MINDVRCASCDNLVWERENGTYYCPNCSKVYKHDSEEVKDARTIQL
jgi:phage FluMu protein Com